MAKELLTSRHALDLLIGVAGSGKTTTVAAVRAGFEEAGYTVIGPPPQARRPKPWRKVPVSTPGRWLHSPGAWSTSARRLGPVMCSSWTRAGMRTDAEMAKLLVP